MHWMQSQKRVPGYGKQTKRKVRPQSQQACLFILLKFLFEYFCQYVLLNAQLNITPFLQIISRNLWHVMANQKPRFKCN